MRRFILISLLTTIFPAFGQVDSLIEQLKGTQGKERIELLNKISYEFAFSDPDRAIKYGNESISLLQHADSALKAQTYNDISICHYAAGNYGKMVELNRKSLKIRLALKDTLGEGANYSKMGLGYQEMGMLDSALLYYKKAIKIFEILGVEQNRLSILNNLANLYDRLGNLEHVLELHEEIQSTAQEIGDDNNYYKSRGNQANALTKLERFDEAEAIYPEIEKYFQEQGMTEQLGTTHLGRGVNFKSMGDTLKAIRYYWKAHQVYSSNGILAPQPLINMANSYMELGKLDSAEVYLIKGIEEADTSNSFTQLRYAYKVYSSLEEKRNNLEKSLEYLKLHLAYDDSVFTETLSDKAAEYQIAFQTEKAKKEKAIEEQKRIEAELEVSSRNKLIYAIVGILVTVVLLSLIIILYRSKKARAEKDAAILKEKEKGIEAVFEATEEERQRIAKDLHDGVGQQMSGLKMAWSNLAIDYKSKLGEEGKKLEELTKILDETASEVRKISHQMMPKVLEEYGLIESLREMLDKSLKLSSIEYSFEHYNFEGRLNRKVELSLYRVAQELINNVIKHSGANVVSVQLFKNRGFLILIVEDNGKAINQETKSDGHGLMNIKSRLDTIKGRVNYEASPNAGTTATIRIDLGE